MKITVVTALIAVLLSIPALAASSEQGLGGSANHAPLSSRIALTAGTPGGLNLCYSFWSRSGPGFRLTAGCLPFIPFGYIVGGQAEFSYRIYEQGATLVDLSAGGGAVGLRTIHDNSGSWLSSSDDDKSWSFVGGFATLNTRGFFLQAGVTSGEKQSPKVQFALQLGVSLYSSHRQ